MKIFQPISMPPRTGLSWEEKWKGEDKGLIYCWELGREFQVSRPDCARLARKGELPVMEWQGGVEMKLKSKVPKLGRLEYLATWQGMRGENLDIDSSKPMFITCSKHNQTVQFGPSKR